MKTHLSLGLFAAACALAACSSDEGNPERPAGGTGGQVATAGTGGTGGGTAGAGGTGTAGTGTGGAGGTGTTLPAGARVGAALTIPAEGPVTDDTEGTGISGGIAVTQSTTMTEDATISTREGGLCFKGITATVPDANSYGTHWGAELIFDLNRVANPDAPATTGDAGADAGGALGLVPADWPRGKVIGFSYTLVGNDTALPGSGVPASRLRFKANPVGANTAQDNYCDDRTPVSGTPETVLFSDITFECWTPGNYTLAESPIQFRQTADMIGTRDNPNAFRSITWQVASDLMVPPIAFDFCVTDLKPVLEP
jgi:hypothetical protein